MDALNRESYALFNGAICEIKQIVNRETYKLNKFLTYTVAARIKCHPKVNVICQSEYLEFHLSMDCFWYEIINGDLVLIEAQESRWLVRAELDSVEWLPADRELIDNIRGKKNHENVDKLY